MELFKRGCFYGSMGGCGLYIAECLCSSLPYMKVSSPLYESWLITSIIIGIIISFFVILYKKSSLLEMVFRFIVMVGMYIVIMIVNGHIGVIRFFYNSLGLNMSSASDNASGLLTVTFWIVIISICIIMMIVETIKRLLNKKL